MPQEKSEPLVLMIDDEESAIKLGKLLLEREGYRFLSASNGEEGITLAVVERPDVILLDILMPKMTGHDALKRLKTDPNTREIPVIMLTAKGAEKDIETSFRQGAIFHIDKPYEIQDLLQKINMALARAAKRGSNR